MALLPMFATSIQSVKSPSSSGRVVSFEAMNSDRTGKLNELTDNRKRAVRVAARGRIINRGGSIPKLIR